MAITISSWYTSGDFRFSELPIICELSTDALGVEENLSAYIEVWIDGAKMTTLSAAYDANGETFVNLQELITFDLIPPDEWSGVYFLSNVQPVKLKLKVADQYGTPATPETLTESDEIVVVPGYYSADFTDMIDAGTDFIILSTPFTAAKPVHLNQSDHLSFIPKIATSASLSVDVYTTDGVKTNHVLATFTSIVGGSFPPGSIVTMIAGPKNITDAGIDLSSAMYYELKIDSYILRTFQILPANHPFETYVTAWNGIGGFETFILSGKRKEGIRVLSERVSHYRPTGQDLIQGDFSDLPKGSVDTLSVNSGFHAFEYILKLKTILSNPIWIWRPSDLEYIRILSATKGGDLYDQATDLQSFDILFEIALLKTLQR